MAYRLGGREAAGAQSWSGRGDTEAQGELVPGNASTSTNNLRC